jgi:hypothetical protein
MKNIAKIQTALIVLGIMLLVHACANKAQGPTGGPKDTTPPRVMKSVPLNNTLNFSKKQIYIDFDEMVSIEKPADNVIISPPQVKPPDVKSYGKRVTVNFNEDLLDSTTYSVNFGNAICDLNEKNPIKNFLFSFSTGNQIDTLSVSGTVIDAENLNPMAGIIVGIYVEGSDSAFYKEPFLRIGRTDENGRFSIDNVKKGRYKIFALGDVNHDYFFQSGEGVAMCDSLINPTFRREIMQDSIWKDSLHFDSIHTYMGTHFLPDNIILRYFKESKKRQYFVKSERKDPFSFNLFYNTEAKELPTIKPLNFNWDGKYIIQKNNTLDSLTYWLTDSTVWKVDTLRMAVTYMKSDSVMKLVPATDTLSVFQRKGRVNPKARQSKVVPKAEPLKFGTNIAGAFEVYNPITVRFEAPLASIDLAKIKLSQKVDTIYKSIPLKWRQVDSTKTSYAIDYKWVPETTYQLKIDSATFVSIYKKVSNAYMSDFKIRSLDEYSSIKIFLLPFNPKAFLQVVDSKDLILATKKASEKGTIVQYLKPGDYYIRMFIDENGNGKWDPGDLAKRIQPEEVFYYSKKLTLMANWEFEETWNYNDTPLLKQKPAELMKDVSKKKSTNSGN